MFKNLFNKIILYGKPQIGQWKIVESNNNEKVVVEDFYSYEQRKEWLDKINELTNGKYYTRLWHGFLNYYNEETNERIGYEVMQVGYYLINKLQKIDL